MQMFMLFFPGALLLFSSKVKKRHVPEVICRMVFLSLSFFIIASLLTIVLPISLQALSFFSIITSISALVLFRNRIVSPRFDRTDGLVLLGFMILFLFRVLPMTISYVPAEAGISRIANVAGSILDSDSMRSSMVAPPGSPALVAISSIVGGLPVFRSTFFISCLAYFLLAPSLYLLLIRFLDTRIAAISAMSASSFVWEMPRLCWLCLCSLLLYPLFWKQDIRSTHKWWFSLCWCSPPRF